MPSGLWTLFLPGPIFWGVLAAWIPVPPAVMAGILCGAMIYALLCHMFSLHEWDIEEAEAAEWEAAAHEPMMV